MATLCVMSISKTNPDPYKDCWCYKAGDVVDILPDGVNITAAEQKFITTVSMPGIDPSQLTTFIAMDFGDPAQNIIPQRRANKFNWNGWNGLQHIPTPILSQVLLLAVAKKRLTDPNVLGQPTGVL